MTAQPTLYIDAQGLVASPALKLYATRLLRTLAQQHNLRDLSIDIGLVHGNQCTTLVAHSPGGRPIRAHVEGDNLYTILDDAARDLDRKIGNIC